MILTITVILPAIQKIQNYIWSTYFTQICKFRWTSITPEVIRKPLVEQKLINSLKLLNISCVIWGRSLLRIKYLLVQSQQWKHQTNINCSSLTIKESEDVNDIVLVSFLLT